MQDSENRERLEDRWKPDREAKLFLWAMAITALPFCLVLIDFQPIRVALGWWAKAWPVNFSLVWGILILASMHKRKKANGGKPEPVTFTGSVIPSYLRCNSSGARVGIRELIAVKRRKRQLFPDIVRAFLVLRLMGYEIQLSELADSVSIESDIESMLSSGSKAYRVLLEREAE